ncbi:MAG: hypothetical protein WCI72_02165 [archaeon]
METRKQEERKCEGSCLEKQIFEIVKLRSRRDDCQVVFEIFAENRENLRKLGAPCSTDSGKHLWERLMEANVDYARAYRALPEDAKKIVGYRELPIYWEKFTAAPN